MQEQKQHRHFWRCWGLDNVKTRIGNCRTGLQFEVKKKSTDVEGNMKIFLQTKAISANDFELHHINSDENM